MSTRSLNLFTFDGRTLITYNHSDGYPSWAGLRALEFARLLTDQATFATALEQARALREHDEGETPTPEERASLAAVTDPNVSSGDDWYSTLRLVQGLPGAILECGHINSLGRGREGSDIEWAYEIDFDHRALHAYEGDATGDPVRTYLFDELPSNEEFVRALGD